MQFFPFFNFYMKLKRLHTVAALCLSIFTSFTHAGILSYDFTATIFHIEEYTPDVGYQVVDSSSLLGDPVATGGGVKGRFYYDTDVYQHDTFLPINTKMFKSHTEQMGMSFVIAGTSISYKSDPGSAYVVIANDSSSSFYGGGDAFELGSWKDGYPSPSRASGHIDLLDFTGTLFGDWSIPSSLSLSDFGNATMIGAFNVPDGHEFFFRANIDSLNSTKIPEPESLLLTVLGLGIMQRFARRKKNSVDAFATHA